MSLTVLHSVAPYCRAADTRFVVCPTRRPVPRFAGAMDWPLLDALPASEREPLLAGTRRRRYARGEAVVREGDLADSLHLVESGRFAVRVDTAAGDTAMLNVLGPGDWFGELSLLDGAAPVRTASVQALEQGTTRSLSAVAFARLRRDHPAAGELLLALMAQRIEQLSGRLVEVMYDGLDRRVFRRLVELVRTYQDSSGPGSGTGAGSAPVLVPLTQEQLAELVGGTRPSVNQVLQRLVREGVVELGRGRIVVLRPAELARRLS